MRDTTMLKQLKTGSIIYNYLFQVFRILIIVAMFNHPQYKDIDFTEDFTGRLSN